LEVPRLKRQRFAVPAVFLIVVLLAGTIVIAPQAVQAASTQTQGGWWNDAYQLRRAVTVSNPGSAPVFNQTVLVYLNFTGSYSQDALGSVRLVDSSGNEVPSVIVGHQYHGIFLSSAYLVFSADIPAGSSSVYYLYYGAPLQSVPSYRASQPSDSLSSGFTTATDQGLSLDSTQIQLGFGTVDTETTMTKVTYTLGGQLDYGPTSISLQPFSNDTGMISAGEIGGPSNVGYETMQAGAVQLTRILILSAKGALTIDAVASGITSTVADVRLTSLVGLRGLSTLGTSSSAYDEGEALLSTQNPDGAFVVSQTPNPASYTLGTSAQVTSEALGGTFAGVASYTLASAAGFAWNLGDLQPGSAAWVSSGWGVSATGPSTAAAPSSPSDASLGQVEVQNSATPIASSVWSATTTINGVPITSGGVVIPFGIGSGVLMPGASSVTGTYAYTFPPSPQQGPQYWSSATSTAGNATALASEQYYDFATRQTVSRLLTFIPGVGSAATSSLTSRGGFTFDAMNDVLQVRYKASYSTVSGNFSAQSFFIAADFDPTLTGNYSQSIFLPVSGSSTALPAGCQSAGSQGAQITPAVPAGFLIGDGTWRTLSLGLSPSLPSSGFDVRLRLCVSSSPGFSGTMDIEVASAGVVHTGSVSQIMQSTFSYAAPALNLGYLPQALPISAVGIRANLSVTLVFQARSSVGWADGSTFDGTIARSSSFTLNSSLGQSSVLNPPRLQGILVGSGISQFAGSGQVNGTSVSVSANPGVVFLDTGGSGAGSSAMPFRVGFRSEALSVQVLDQDQKGVPGVTIVPSANGVKLPITLVTDFSGGAQVQLVPWTYQFNATYQGFYVGSAGAQVGSQSSASIAANIYQLTLLVKDARGGLIPGAQVTLTIGNLTFTGTTDNQGRYPFEAVANALYGLTVGLGSGTYFSGQIGATANNAVVQVSTTYLPSSVELAIAVLLAIIPVALIVAYFATRRLRSSS